MSRSVVSSSLIRKFWLNNNASGSEVIKGNRRAVREFSNPGLFDCFVRYMPYRNNDKPDEIVVVKMNKRVENLSVLLETNSALYVGISITHKANAMLAPIINSSDRLM